MRDFSITIFNTPVLMVVGEDGVELWSPQPNNVSCALPPFQNLRGNPSVDLVGGRIIACSESRCEELGSGGWEVVRGR